MYDMHTFPDTLMIHGTLCMWGAHRGRKKFLEKYRYFPILGNLY